MAGAMQVARTFLDLPVVPVAIDSEEPLKHYVCLAAYGVLTGVLTKRFRLLLHFPTAVGPCKTAQHVLQRMEREATFRYQTIHVESDEAVNCIHVNGYTIYRSDIPDATEVLFHYIDSVN